MQLDKNTQADFDFYSDVVKESRGSRPRGLEAEWFISLSEAERQAEINKHCNYVNEETELEIAQHKADLKYLQSFGNFTEKQLVAWGCL